MRVLMKVTLRNTQWVLHTLALALGLAGHVFAQAQAQAQTPAPATAPATALAPSQSNAKPATVGKPAAPAVIKTATPIAAAVVETKPLWKELTPPQQVALKPLAANWATIEEAQKRKWLAMSNTYPSLPAAEQQKMHSRMAEWTTLSQQQRTQARLNFAESNKLAPKEKAEKAASKTADWEAYQALSAEDKQKLAAKGAPKPAGAAMAIKPPAPEKLATVPLTRLSPKPTEPASKLSAVDGNALQPKAAGTPNAQAAPGSAVQKN
jgi:Protein of unknown function (DUF3106)